jgi:hypothetical protein
VLLLDGILIGEVLFFRDSLDGVVAFLLEFVPVLGHVVCRLDVGIPVAAVARHGTTSR